MTDKQSSTLQSYVDSAIAAGHSVLGNITGNQPDKETSATTQASAENESASSHTVGKLGPIAVTPSGGISTDDPARAEGSWNQTVGAAKESIGTALGAEGLKQDGRRQNAEGQGQEAEGQLRDLGTGVSDRVKGGVEGAVAGLVGDRDRQEKARLRHDDGKAAERSAEADIIKQNQ